MCLAASCSLGDRVVSDLPAALGWRGVLPVRALEHASPRAKEVLGQAPVSCMAEEISTPGDGQIKALITVAGNRCYPPQPDMSSQSARRAGSDDLRRN